MNVKNKRKAGYAALLVISLLALAVLFFVTDGAESRKAASSDSPEESVAVKAPVFSESSGFYAGPFYLRIAAPKGTTVYYTLDGSDPDENATEYTEPVYLENATVHENVYAMRTDVSTGFYTDLIEQRQTMDKVPHYAPPDYQIDKCNVVRAIAVDKNGRKSSIATGSYFVGLSPGQYHHCNIVSVVSDPSNFFDEHKGIYVTGSTFDKYLNDARLNSQWRLWKANYNQRGREWERAASFEFFDENGKLLLSKIGGIRIQGGISRGMLPRSFNLYAREEYDGSEIFRYEFFTKDAAFYPHIVTLASGGNQTITQFNDIMMADRVGGLDFAVMDFEPYVLFIDGEYWGFYRLASKFDENFIAYKYPVDKDNIAIIKNGGLECGTNSSLNHYQQMRDFIIRNDMKDSANYAMACEYIDIESFLDYYAVQIYIARQNDWPMANFALWRSVEQRDEAYADGKWRWILFDSNSTSMTSELVNHDTLKFVMENDELFASLWENEAFRKAFEARILDIADRCFDAAEMDEYINHYTTEMRPILTESWKRFYGKDNDKEAEYENLMNSYQVFFDNRKAVVEAWFNNSNN